MRGFIDEFGLSFVTVDFGQGPLDFMIDTGFTGTLIVGEQFFDSRRAEYAGPTDAELADEAWAEYETYYVEFDWFGETIRARILDGPGKTCLLGVALLMDRRLEIDYPASVVNII